MIHDDEWSWIMKDDEWWMYEYFQRTKAEIPGLSGRNQACKDKTLNHGIFDPIRRRSWHSKFWTEWAEHVEVYVNAIDYRKCMVSTQGRWNTKIQGCNDDVQGGKTLKRQQGRETFGSSWKDEKLSRLPQWNQAKARQFLKPGSIATVHTSRAQSARALLGNFSSYCWWSKILLHQLIW